MIFNWKSAAYIRKQLPQKERLIKKCVIWKSIFFHFLLFFIISQPLVFLFIWPVHLVLSFYVFHLALLYVSLFCIQM